jgi:hypothetical protein
MYLSVDPSDNPDLVVPVGIYLVEGFAKKEATEPRVPI